MSSAKSKRIAVLGLGLMGGSLGLALRARGGVTVAGYARRKATLDRALELGAVDEAHTDPRTAATGAHAVVVCTPVLSIPALVRDIRAVLPAGAVVTDVGSTKSDIVREAGAALAGSGAVFVGSHPMAGSERTGIEAARADLYADAVVAVTPGTDAAPEAEARVRALWESVGARVVRLDPAEHDRLVARTSHLVHLVASLLVGTVGRNALPGVELFCGPGFRDTTRVASSSPEVWDDIVRTNPEAILGELRAFEALLDALAARIEARDFEAVRGLLEKGRALRARLLGG